MFASFLITFRETLEAALVIGIVLSFLIKTQQHHFQKYVWLGAGLGIGVAVILSIALSIFFGGLTGRVEEIFEGILMFVTAGLLTWMILWVHRQKNISKNLRDSTASYIQKGFPLGITFLILTSVMREGVETVLYLQAVSRLGGENQLIGALLGMFIAGVLGIALFRYSLKINLHQLLKISGAILLLFAAGLVSHGVHEFQEANLLPLFHFDPLINITNILDNNSVLGSLLRTLFGYTAKPSLLELLSYGGYVFLIFLLELWTNKALTSGNKIITKK